VTESIHFSFDPRCPWCYQTSRWALRLEALHAVELYWSVFCLELNRFTGEHETFDPDSPSRGPRFARAWSCGKPRDTKPVVGSMQRLGDAISLIWRTCLREA
jgi:hypothetical protein